MPIELKLKVHKDYLEAEFIGNRDTNDELEESIELWSKIPAACDKNGLHRIIAISRLDKRLTVDNTFVFVDQFKAIGWKPNYKLAGVVFDEKLLLEYELLVTFINNFGYTCKIFNNMKDARKWVLQK